MAKQILEGKPRRLRDVGGTLYLLIEQPQAKILDVGVGSYMIPTVYWSEKHQDYFLAAYKVDDIAQD